MGFNDIDREWMDKCQNHPEKYQIAIYNGIFVKIIGEEKFCHQFNMTGIFFIKQLLDYIGCNAELG